MLTEDVCLPRGRLAEMLARIEEIAARHDVLIATVAHAGDGNLHPLMLTPHGDDAAKAARAARRSTRSSTRRSSWAARSPASTGSGCSSGRACARELGAGVLALQRAVKQALDPDGILNPGKVVG